MILFKWKSSGVIVSVSVSFSVIAIFHCPQLNIESQKAEAYKRTRLHLAPPLFSLKFQKAWHILFLYLYFCSPLFLFPFLVHLVLL